MSEDEAPGPDGADETLGEPELDLTQPDDVLACQPPAEAPTTDVPSAAQELARSIRQTVSEPLHAAATAAGRIASSAVASGVSRMAAEVSAGFRSNVSQMTAEVSAGLLPLQTSSSGLTRGSTRLDEITRASSGALNIVDSLRAPGLVNAMAQVSASANASLSEMLARGGAGSGVSRIAAEVSAGFRSSVSQMTAEVSAGFRSSVSQMTAEVSAGLLPLQTSFSGLTRGSTRLDEIVRAFSELSRSQAESIASMLAASDLLAGAPVGLPPGGSTGSIQLRVNKEIDWIELFSWFVGVLVMLMLVQGELSEANRLGSVLWYQNRVDLFVNIAGMGGLSFAAKKQVALLLRRIFRP